MRLHETNDPEKDRLSRKGGQALRVEAFLMADLPPTDIETLEDELAWLLVDAYFAEKGNDE